MYNLVLKDGRILEISNAVSTKLGVIIALSSWNRNITINGETFTPADIVQDKDKRTKMLQTGMDLGVMPVVIHKGKKKVDKLS